MTRLPSELYILLKKETYLFGCGAKRINNQRKQTTFSCAFFPSPPQPEDLLEYQFPYDDKSYCDCCQYCVDNQGGYCSKSGDCGSDAMKAFCKDGCKRCSKNAKSYYSLCGN